MKKIFATLMMMAMIAISVPVLSTTATAQTRRYYQNRQVYTTPYNSNTYDTRSTYQKHRNLINVGIGTGAGALIGALFGGGKGALIGGAIGAGGSALYTYKINPKRPRYYSRRY